MSARREHGIAGVEVRPLTIIRDERGAVLHMLRSDAAGFAGFGEIYFSEVAPRKVKAWRRHSRAITNLAVPHGRIRFVAFDDRHDSDTRGCLVDIEVGDSNYVLITVAPGIWNGFAALGDEPALVCNCSTLPHDPAEADRLPPDTATIPYDWSTCT